MRYYSQALELSSVDPKLAVSIYNNRGNTLKDSGKPELAIREYQQALKILTQLQAPAIEAQVNRNIALTAIDQNNLHLARDAAKQGLSAAKLDGDAGTSSQFNALNAYLLLNSGEPTEARRLIDKVFTGVDLSKTPLAARIDHEFAFKIYQRLGDSEKALAHLTALKRLDDQATQLAISTGTALMSARFDYANQNLNIARLKRAEAQRSLELERSRAHFQRILFTGSAVAALIVFGMLGFGIVTLRRSRNEVRAANIELAASNSALEKALAAKTEFLATTSHEIRTPLNGILGMTQVMLSDTRISPETRDRISIVHGAGVTMRALVDDILDVAKMETGNMTIENAPFDLAALVTDLARMWRDQATTKGLAFEMHTEACPKMIMGDAARLRQIVFNLLSNALKFTAEGKVGLEVKASDGRLRITVSDTGIGIPPDKQGIIFESFRQGDAGTTRQFGGTGLGLSICRNLARAMGGDVLVTSAPGEGSTFTIDLPLVLAEQPAAAVAPGDDAPALLVIDRNPITRSMLKALLAPRAGAVLATGSTADALPMLADNTVARVLVDAAALEGGEGDDAAANLSTLVQAAKARGATLVLMAPADHPILQSAANDVIEALVSKPITGAALVELLYPVGGAGTAAPETGLVSQAA
ncbi:ATP-binding protein [Sphingomonas sp. GlSt437]|uniref:ATP-binding protein n=1 Tax=Sphingomonas sp. GlSt437 TaxID=3389970 RepID=UPI003A8C2FC1